MSNKTQKELAFLRDLYIDSDWTQRFTDLADKHLGAPKGKTFLYINAGTGNHLILLRKKIGKKAEVFAVCENEDILAIARDKAAAVQSNINFSMGGFADDSFDSVLADASFAPPAALQKFVNEAVRVAEPGGKVAFFTITAGSFGEIFSLLWEIFFNEHIAENGAVTEQLIAELPTIAQVEEIAKNAGLEITETHTQNELFDYKNGTEFVGSPLISDFLLPIWLKTLNKKEQTKARKKLAALIDAEGVALTFCFSVKATVVAGEKRQAETREG